LTGGRTGKKLRVERQINDLKIHQTSLLTVLPVSSKNSSDL